MTSTEDGISLRQQDARAGTGGEPPNAPPAPPSGMPAQVAGIVAWIRRDAPSWSEPDVALAIADDIEAGAGWLSGAADS